MIEKAGGVLRLFKSSKELMCSCKPKYAMNTYSNCSHGCVYCYGRPYQRHGQPRARKEILKELEKELSKAERLPVCLSPIVDPYTPEEEKYGLTKKVLRALTDNGFPILIMTKSDLVLRDLDILNTSDCVVSLTVTTLDKEKAARLEPKAPSPERRLNALKQLSGKIPVTARIEPIIPYCNDREDELEQLVKELSYSGVRHITSGMLRIVRPCWGNIRRAVSEPEKLEELYFKKPDKRFWYWYAPKDVRYKSMRFIKDLAEKYKMSFGCCREGFRFGTAACDGQDYLGNVRKNRIYGKDIRSLDEFGIRG